MPLPTILGKLIGLVTGIVSAFGGVILQVANFLILILALIVGGLCGALLRGSGIIRSFQEEALTRLHKELSEYGISLPVSANDVDFTAPIRGPLFALCALAAFLGVIAALGIIAVCTRNSVMLVLYGAMLGLVLLIEVALWLSVRNGPGMLARMIKLGVELSFEKLYAGPGGTDPYTLAWNSAMVNFQCCGVSGYQDFNNTQKWNRTIVYEDVELEVEMPLECCKPRGNEDKVVHLLGCTSTNSTNNYKDTGCYTKCWGELQDIVRSAQGGTAIFISFMVQVGAIGVVVIMYINGFTPSLYSPIT